MITLQSEFYYPQVEQVKVRGIGSSSEGLRYSNWQNRENSVEFHAKLCLLFYLLNCFPNACMVFVCIVIASLTSVNSSLI